MTVTDNDGATGSDTVVIIVLPNGTVNTPPVADAGPDSIYVSGLALDADGNRVEAQHAPQSIVRYGSGTGEVLAIDYEGDIFNSPNDLVVHSNGTIYFTDPTFGNLGNLGAVTSQPLGFTGVFSRDPQGNIELIDTLTQPNGIGLSADESTLFVSSYSGGTLVSYTLNADGEAISGAQPFASGLAQADGFCLDSHDNIYITANGNLTVLGADGTHLGEIAIPGTTTNCAFGGNDMRTLFVTTRNTLYSFRTSLSVRHNPATEFL